MLARPDRLRLTVVRTAMLFGVLALGGVTWFLQRDGRTATADPAALAGLTKAFFVLLGLTLAGLILLRLRVADAAPAAQRAMYLGGYTAAEVVAIFGGALWFLGGDRVSYLLGLVLMAVSFQVLPIPRD